MEEVLQFDSNWDVSVGLVAERALYTQAAELRNNKATWETIGSLILFSMVVLTRNIQNRAHKFLLRLGDLSSGRLMDISQIMATGRIQHLTQ
jgi:hypothetical protein